MCALRMRSLAVLPVVLLFASVASVRAGTISGTVTNPEKCGGVQVLLRTGPGVKYACLPGVFDADFDRETGAFRAADLPEGEYDLRVLVRGGWVDGVDMRLEEPEEEVKPFEKKDEEAIRSFIKNYPDSFTDTHRVLFVRGNGRFAKVVVEKIRARQFHSGEAGEIVWRVEIWKFEKHTGAWIKSQRGKTAVSRLRVFKEGTRAPKGRLQITSEKFEKMLWLFSPDMGGYELFEDEPIEGLKITVPRLSMQSGKMPGSVKKQIEEYYKKEPEPYLR